MSNFFRATRETGAPITKKEIKELKESVKVGDKIRITLDWLFKDEVTKVATVVGKHEHIAELWYKTAAGKTLTTAITWQELAVGKRKGELKK